MITQQRDAMRRSARARYVEELREGRRQRAVTVPAKKGPGSYNRKAKHRQDWRA